MKIAFRPLIGLFAAAMAIGFVLLAGLIAPHSRRFTGIDLTDAACIATRARLELSGVQATIERMDAESMQFESGMFDFVWSWGVIHHSSDTSRVLREMHRVLRPGGRACVMVYFRAPVRYYLVNGFARGILLGEFVSIGNIHRINQACTDGALARFFSLTEFAELLRGLFVVDRTMVTGQKADALPLPEGRLKAFLVERVPDRVTRELTERFGMGTFLIVEMTRA